MKTILICFILAMIITIAVRAQKKTGDAIAGVWKGTSLCQVKPSPCNDENVVYHITRAKTDSTYTVQMNKIINGEEDEMASMDVVYDANAQTLRGTTSRNGRTGFWFFKLDGQKLHGTLTINENVLYRVIEVEKNSAAEGKSSFINNSNGDVTGHK